MTDSVLIICSDVVTRDGLADRLHEMSKDEVDGAATVTEALQRADRREPQLVLLNAGPGLIAAINQITSAWPDVRLMVISREVDALPLWQTLKIGGHGFGIYGGEDLTSFLAAAQAIRRGQTAVCARCLPLLVNAFVRLVPDADARNLTPRQQEVLELLACGLQAKEIARHLHIALPTVRKHLAHIFQKYDVASSREAVMRFTRSLHASQAGLQYLRRATPPLPDVATEPAPRERAAQPEGVQSVTSARAKITTPS